MTDESEHKSANPLREGGLLDSALSAIPEKLRRTGGHGRRVHVPAPVRPFKVDVAIVHFCRHGRIVVTLIKCIAQSAVDVAGVVMQALLARNDGVCSKDHITSLRKICPMVSSEITFEVPAAEVVGYGAPKLAVAVDHTVIYLQLAKSISRKLSSFTFVHAFWNLLFRFIKARGLIFGSQSQVMGSSQEAGHRLKFSSAESAPNTITITPATKLQIQNNFREAIVGLSSLNGIFCDVVKEVEEIMKGLSPVMFEDFVKSFQINLEEEIETKKNSPDTTWTVCCHIMMGYVSTTGHKSCTSAQMLQLVKLEENLTMSLFMPLRAAFTMKYQKTSVFKLHENQAARMFLAVLRDFCCV
ncbi:hypothetical protein FNV43_RR21571 [Rhamnella rubrinervis]|uniref:Uncharacterized protein n=1 Tax=Rhamnella rubrinervis TaxID=2594499 RepID=A0A8K0GV59_9ROSA|nr:hypothetical protein FNV43_RR21571 [Rhamnella rubrinervis]